MRRAFVAVAGLLMLVTAGCGDGGRESAAAGTALRMSRAVASGDGGTACALLAPETAAAVAESEGTSCAEAVLKEGLPEPGGERGADVYGQWARVRLDGDTVFLAVFPGGWRVVAAGCEPRPGDQPYDCALDGR